MYPSDEHFQKAYFCRQKHVLVRLEGQTGKKRYIFKQTDIGMDNSFILFVTGIYNILA